VATGGPRLASRRSRVDVGASLALAGTLTKLLGAAPLFPLAVALVYSEPFWPFLVAGAVAVAVGVGLERLGDRGATVGAREGFFVVALVWLLAAAFGALPYVLSGEDQFLRPVDALFEGMSGFTTTGATILTDIESLPRSLLMWRQLTQWLGGIGIIVLALAVLPRLRVGGRQLMESELPGPEVGGLSTRIRDTARRFWFLYLALTAAEALVLAVLGWTGIDPAMNLFNAVAHALTTVPTGGFSPQNRSIEPFAAATQWVILGFMILGGINFALLYAGIVRRRVDAVVRDEELRLYLTVVLLASLVLTVEIWTKGFETGEDAIRHAVFQATAVLTTTGYVTEDYTLWPTLALVTLVGLMFAGASAGSTSGSVKILRHLLMGKILRRELDQTVHPEVVQPLRLNGVAVEERVLRAVMSFALLYIGLFVVAALVITVDASFNGPAATPFEAIGAAAATLGNVGPAVGFAGPMGSYEPFSDVSTLVMIGLMWLGRLELLPVLVLLTRSYWLR
jgi:trk system potassium uptake protein TrkH